MKRGNWERQMVYIYVTKDGLLKLQQSAQLEEQYNNDSLRNITTVCDPKFRRTQTKWFP